MEIDAPAIVIDQATNYPLVVKKVSYIPFGIRNLRVGQLILNNDCTESVTLLNLLLPIVSTRAGGRLMPVHRSNHRQRKS